MNLKLLSLLIALFAAAVASPVPVDSEVANYLVIKEPYRKFIDTRPSNFEEYEKKNVLTDEFQPYQKSIDNHQLNDIEYGKMKVLDEWQPYRKHIYN